MNYLDYLIHWLTRLENDLETMKPDTFLYDTTENQIATLKETLINVYDCEIA